MKQIIKKYYPFWLGLFMIICLLGTCVKYNIASFAVIGAYLIGFFKLSKLHEDEKF